VRFRLLGPLEVWTGETWSAIRSPQQRTLLAILLIDAGRVVTTDRLVDEIWGEQPPRTAANIVQGYVMRLRRLMGGCQAGPLVTRGGGYQLIVEDDDVDVAVFDRLVETGKHQLAQRRPRDGAARLAEALELWRGAAFADVPAGRTVSGAAHQLEQRRLNAVEDRVDAQLALGQHADIVDELYRLVGEAPLRERLLSQLMLALYRCGRRGDALDAYRTGRRVLVAELGLEPGTRLRELERAILTDDGVADGAVPGLRAAAQVNPAQLPADVAGFTGRSEYLRQLSQRAPDRAAALGILAITGAGGVGKTALAVHWAHRVRHRFPDGQLYVNLRGFAANAPVRPIEALAGFLLALGVPADDIPLDEARAATLYRSVLADSRTLVVLDNARNADQVRPLLPGSPGCLVLITSRDQMRGLVALNGAVRLAVDVLTHTESRALLCLLLGEKRVLAESEASDELVRLCGHLPLALRIAGSDLADHPRRTIGDYAARLDTGNRLEALQVDGDQQAGVRAAFGLSYTALPPQARRLFRLLGLVPGQDVTAPVAAALADTTSGRAAELLERLATAHLIEEHAAGRYTLHDLLRLYAAEQAGSAEHESDRAAALGRLHDHYLASADAAARLLYPEKVRLPIPDLASGQQCFPDNTAAMCWLDAERHNLLAVIQHAAEHGPRATACLLADTLRGYLDIRMYTVDWLTAAQTGSRCAERDGDLPAQAAAQLSLALLHWKQSQSQRAVEHYTHALALTGRAGWLDGHAAALGNLGRVYADLGKLEQAAAYHAQALAIDRRTGWLAGQATKLGNLGEVYHELGRLDEAMTTLTESLDLHRQVGSGGSEAAVLRTLAVVHRDTGAPADALRLATQAVTVSRGIGGQRQLAKALNTLATIHHELGDDRLAQAGHQEAMDLARERRDRYGEIEALTGLAAAKAAAGNHSEAVADAECAVMIARHAGARLLEARALTTLAKIQLSHDNPDTAADNAKAALTIHAATGQRLDQARTHLVVGHALRETGDEHQARDHLDAARTLFIESGADWTGQTSTLAQEISDQYERTHPPGP
jgi:DNA-binding SARP family transcriptional activator/tetratricopeptide (TPR) repeat protein